MNGRTIFYALCPLPAACLLISHFLPADSRTTPPAERHAFDWMALAVIGGPLLAFVGLINVFVNYNEGKDVRGWAIATAVAALPSLYFLATTVIPR